MKKLNNIGIARKWYNSDDYKDLANLDAEGWRDKLMAFVASEKIDIFRVKYPELADEGLVPVTDLDEIDHFLLREQAIQSCNDLESLNSRHRIALEIDLYCPDEILIKQFISELKNARRDLGITIKRRGAGRPKSDLPQFNSSVRFAAWREYKILELTDLEVRIQHEGYLPLSNVQLAEILFPAMAACNNAEKSKQISEARSMRKEAFSTLRTLQAQTKSDRNK